jgi:predicted dehydrogenase
VQGSKSIRLAIAGLRHPHIDAIIDEARLRTDVELVAIAEQEPAIRTQYAAKLQVREYADHNEMFARSGADVVGIGAINAHRGRIATDALRAGLHVLADKPLCTTLDQLTEIESAWRTSGRALSIAFEKRFYPATLALEPLLAERELGRLAIVAASAPHKLTRARRPGWMFDRDAYGGIINDLAVHDIDLLLHFSGAKAGHLQASVSNTGNTDRPEFQDAAVVSLRTDDGLLATFEVHWFSPEAAPYHGDYRMRLVGTQGTAELLWKDNRLDVATHARPPWTPPLPDRLRPAQDFFDAVLAGKSPRITAEASFAATRLALLAQQSAEAGTPIRWDLTADSAP